MLKSNYHTHTKLCKHATGDVIDYIEKAIAYGYEEIGMSDHAPIPKEFFSEEMYEHLWLDRTTMTLGEFYAIYLKDLEKVKEKYKDQISIKKGLEIEYIPGQEAYYKALLANLDYLNFGPHYFINSKGEYKNSYSEVDYKNVSEYATNVENALKTGFFKCIVHPDLFFYDYKNKEGKKEWDEECTKASRRIIESAIKNNVVLEINVNGVKNSRSHGCSEWLYPRVEFFKIAKEYKDAKFIIGCDAHDPEYLNSKDIEEVVEFVKRLGLKIEDRILM